MKRVLLFGGTADSRELARFLCQEGCRVELRVASGYAAGLCESRDGLSVTAGRLDLAGMASLMQEGGYDCVVDATHPYAREATENIRSAAGTAGLRRFRLLREESGTEGFIRCQSVEEAAGLLCGTAGPVFIATGSKELEKYTRIPDFAARCFVRVLPAAGALEKCAALGFRARNVMAMQGPFSKELNAALFKQLGIKYLVTKDGGAAGGFPEKAAAAKECGVKLIVVSRPRETGLSMDEIKAELTEYLSLAKGG